MSYLVVFVELIIGFIALFITVKSLGKTQISQITPFDFISSLVLGELVGSAIFENNGFLSVLRKVEVDYPLNKDLNVQKENNVIPYTVISDGKVIVENLKLAGLNEAWLYMELESHGVKHPKEICYAEWQVGKKLYFQKY